jgi:precorrin-3B synthase
VRIVAARDGGICRIKLAGGELSAQQARIVADASVLHAGGVIELTNRANLQIRGVRSGHEAALSAALVDAGLGPTPASPELDTTSISTADDVRNVMVSPLAGRDRQALLDTSSLCAQLLALLQGEARFAALSPKFAVLLDGGERLARVDHPHDVWLAAHESGDGVRFAFGLAGCPPVVASARAPRAGGTGALATVLPAQVPALVRALLHTFVDLASTDATRMRHLLATHDADALLQHAQRYVDFPLARDASLAGWHRNEAADASLRLGAHPQREAGMWHAGGQPPLGRVDAAMLHGLAMLARRDGNGSLRVTPWQSVLLPDVATHALPAALGGLKKLGLACDPAQAITRLIACAGSSGCAKSLADTKADALKLAALLPANADADLGVHLSGCPRSCAAAHCAPFTLLAAAPGLYDLYRRDDRSGSPGTGETGFGKRVAQQLTIEQAASLLDHLARSHTDA